MTKTKGSPKNLKQLLQIQNIQFTIISVNICGNAST